MSSGQSIPQIIGVSELRTSQKQVLERLTNGPIVLAQRNQPLAVLVEVETWNRMVNELGALRDERVLLGGEPPAAE